MASMWCMVAGDWGPLLRRSPGAQKSPSGDWHRRGKVWLTSGPLRCARNGRGDDGKHGDDHGGKAGGDCAKRRAFEGHEGTGKRRRGRRVSSELVQA